MKKIIIAIALMLLTFSIFAQFEIQNAVATPGAGSVTISYDLVASGSCKITVVVSKDSGTSYNIYPTALAGDVGDQIIPGNGKQIIWQPAGDNMEIGSSYRVKVIARENPNPGAQDDFILISGGTFRAKNHSGTDTDHYSTVSPYYIDKYEITQAEYLAVMGVQPASDYGVGPNHAVYNVSWFDAIEYSNRRSLQEGMTPCYSYSTHGTNPDDWYIADPDWKTDNENGFNVSCDWTANGYRLPTVMEWMFAAMGADPSGPFTYSGSNSIEDVAWYISNSNNMGASHPDYGVHHVGEKLANQIGTFDMSGNVREYAWDIYISPTNFPAGNFTDWRGPDQGATGTATNRAIRGGDWARLENHCRVYSGEFGAQPTSLGEHRGFRVVRNAP